MFKKSLLAVAVLGTAAGFACAADVTLYGKVDMGLVYTDTQTKTTIDGVTTKEKEHVFDMQNGVNAASRFGLKGTEDLGNGLKVGFKLENGFNADDGSFGDNDRLFNREASLTVSGDFGALSMGRMGGVGSGAGTYNLFTVTADAFDGGNVDTFGLVTTSRYDNMITYQTPKFAGVQGTFQYSFKGDSKQKNIGLDTVAREGSAAADRYASIGLTGDFGALQTVLTYERINYASNNGANLRNKDAEDGQLISIGGNYDCGFAKTFIAAQYFKDMKAVENLLDTPVGYEKGYTFGLGAIVPVAGGDLTTAFYYQDADTEFDGVQADREGSYKYYGLTTKYEYPLSKRTSLYTGAGVFQEKDEYDSKREVKATQYQAFAGLTHSF